MKKLLILFLLVCGTAHAGLPPTRILDEGVDQGVFFKLDCVGSGVECTQSGITGTMTVTSSGGSSDFENSGWTDAGTVVNLVTTTDAVTIGSETEAGKLFVDGDTDEIQLQIQGNSTQTNPLMSVEDWASNEYMTVHGTGLTAFVDIIGNTATIGEVTGNASTATALAANPSDCGANSFATTIAANGDLTCSTPTLGTDTDGNYVATLADAGNSTITVANGTAEGGAATVDAVDVNCSECLIIGTEVKAGTLTDTKYCTWDDGNSQVVCNSEGGGNAYESFVGDKGSTTASSSTDTMTVQGQTGLTVSINNDTIYIETDEADYAVWSGIIADTDVQTSNIYDREDITLTVSDRLNVTTGGVSGITFGTGATASPCSVFGEGGMFYNDTDNVLCYCNGTSTLKISDDSSCF